MQWFYSNNGQQQGPVEEAELQQLLNEGTVSGTDLAWNADMSDWQPIHSLSQFTIPSNEVTATSPTAATSPATTTGPTYSTPNGAPNNSSSNALSITSMVLGILSLICVCCAYIGLALGIAAVICGHISLKKIKKSATNNGKGMTIAGLITGYIGSIIGLILAASTLFLTAGSPEEQEQRTIELLESFGIDTEEFEYEAEYDSSNGLQYDNGENTGESPDSTSNEATNSSYQPYDPSSSSPDQASDYQEPSSNQR